MKAFIICLVGALFTYNSTDLFSESIFSSVVSPIFFVGFVFTIFVKVFLRFFSEPMHTKPTEGEKKVIRALFGKGSAYRNRIDD
jgi:hypothetical protein